MQRRILFTILLRSKTHLPHAERDKTILFLSYECLQDIHARRSAFVVAIDNFTKRAVSGSLIIVFYYAGHGFLTSEGHHCMMTRDYGIRWPHPSDAGAEAAGYGVEQALQRILDAAPGCRLIALLDTCREIATMRSPRGKALTVAARPAAPPHLELSSCSETLVCHACRFGAQASDNAGSAAGAGARNEFYTSHLLQ